MSPIRRLAVIILGAVVRWASPGCKEWALGLARELEFIDSDWRALGWALGSTRVVLDRREEPIGSGSKPARPSLLNVSSWFFYFYLCFWSGAKMLTSTGGQQRLGWGLVLLLCGYWATCSVFAWLRERWRPSTSDLEAYRRFLRADLERFLSRSRTVRRWFPMLAVLSGFVGCLLIQSEVRFLDNILGLFALLVRYPTKASIRGQIRAIHIQLAAAEQIHLKPKRIHSDHWGRARPSEAD